MDYSTYDFDRSQGRELLTSVIVPRSVVWISTLARDGESSYNLAPFSSIAPVCNRPPLLSFCCHRRDDGSQKRTATNIHESGEFVVNTVSPALLDKVCSSAEQLELGVDKFSHAGVTPGRCKVVKAPRVTEAIASLECVVHKCVEIGEGDAQTDLFIGRIVHVHLSPDQETHGVGADGDNVALLAAMNLDWYLVRGETVFRPQAKGLSGKRD